MKTLTLLTAIILSASPAYSHGIGWHLVKGAKMVRHFAAATLMAYGNASYYQPCCYAAPLSTLHGCDYTPSGPATYTVINGTGYYNGPGGPIQTQTINGTTYIH